MKPNNDILRVIEILDFRHQPHTIKKTHVLAWFESSDRNVLGAATDAVLKNWNYIQPSLTQRDLGGALMKNFSASLNGGNDELSVYAYTCHEAARVFCDWTLEAYSESSGQMAEEHVQAAKQFLAEKYRAGDERQRNCIVAGALEHIFEVEEMRELFADWKNDPTLAKAYRESEAWASWAARRARSLQSVALGIAQALERSGHQGVAVQRPVRGSGMPTVTWADGQSFELAIDCDAAWLQQFEAGKIDIKKAENFAATSDNWSESSLSPGHYTVELKGASFLK